MPSNKTVSGRIAGLLIGSLYLLLAVHLTQIGKDICANEELVQAIHLLKFK